jgi:hypothetical protein
LAGEKMEGEEKIETLVSFIVDREEPQKVVQT